jgi:ABC-type multidrug transport system fused ATPase/permease subunit
MKKEELIEHYSIKDAIRTARRAFSIGFRDEPALLWGKIILTIAVAVVGYIQIASFSKIIDEIVVIQKTGNGITRNLLTQSWILALSFLIPAILENIEKTFLEKFKTRIITHNTLRQVDALASLDIGTIQGSEFQTKLERASKWGIGTISNVIIHGTDLIRNTTSLVMAGVLLASVSWYLVILAIAGSITYYFIENKYGIELFRIHHIVTDANRVEWDRIMQFRDPRKIVEVLLYNIKALFRGQIKKLATEHDDQLTDVATRKARATIAADIIQTVCLLLAIGLVTFETLQGRVLVGSLFLAFSVYRSFVTSSQFFFVNLSRLEEQSRFTRRWFDIFDLKPAITSKPDALKPNWMIAPTIEFKNVDFTYPEARVAVLKNVSLFLKSGEKLAIVGENGAGKTTLIRLLCRVYDPTKGQILIDGIDLRDINIDHWREYLGVLFQDFNNYQMTVREAIAIARSNDPIDDVRVRAAATIAEAHTFIEELPKKYDQILWKGFQDGAELSKGQFQRMAVARIFYRDALISILDEPTSAIDAVAEEKIFEVLERKMEGKTVVLISHRFSTVKNADKIAVVEHGEIKEQGSHKELMKLKGRYAELYTMQAKRYLE